MRLSAGLTRLGAYNFSILLNPVTRSYFEAMSKFVEPDVAADMRAVLKSPTVLNERMRVKVTDGRTPLPYEVVKLYADSKDQAGN